MATSVKLHQVRELVNLGGSPPTYKFRITSTCSEPTGGIEKELFLFRDSDDEYVHVATLGDHEKYPNSKTGADYYRQDSVVLEYDDVEDAVDESDLQKTRLQAVVTDYEEYKESSFIADETIVYSSP